MSHLPLTRSAVRSGVLWLVALALVAISAPAHAGKPQPMPPPVPPPRSFGVTMAGLPGDPSGLNTLTASLGRAPDRVMWYAAWSSGGNFPSQAASQIAATGATPELTWEPWDPSAGVNQPAYALDRIAAGDYDSYLSRWARQIKLWKSPLIIRFGHEMNGSWYPWAEQVNGNGPGDYVAAWRHVRQVFSNAGATNVTWQWSPNVVYPGSTPLGSLCPGDAQVDEVALDGYNWATLQPGSVWSSFWTVFGDSVGQVRTLTTKPLSIGEVGCPEVGGDKAAWVTDMFATLAAHPEVRGVMWFDYLKEADWRIDSSPASLAAFRTGLTGYR